MSEKTDKESPREDLLFKHRMENRGKRKPLPKGGLPKISNPELTPEEEEILEQPSFMLAEDD